LNGRSSDRLTRGSAKARVPKAPPHHLSRATVSRGAQGRRPRRGKPQDYASGGFLRGTQESPLKAREVRATGDVATAWGRIGSSGQYEKIPMGSPGPSSRACGARPSAGWAMQARVALRGRPGNDAKGDFLGGARSPRPQIRAGPKPGHVTLTGSLARAWWPKNATFGLA
jgi:hypothetical protein